MRPAPWGPRSVTTQLMDAPVAVRVTVITVPMGAVGWAHSPGLYAYQLAPPSCWFAGPAVVGGVVVVEVELVVVARGLARAVSARGAVEGGSATVDEGAADAPSAPVVPVVGGATGTVVAVSIASALTAWAEAAPASVRGMSSIRRMGSATTVNQTAKNKRRRGTTYGCRTSSSWASRAPSFFWGSAGWGSGSQAVRRTLRAS